MKQYVILSLLYLLTLKNANLFVKSEHEVGHVTETTQTTQTTQTLLLSSEGSQLTTDKIDFSSTAHGDIINIIENKTSQLHFEIDAADSMDSIDAVDSIDAADAMPDHTKQAHDLHKQQKAYVKQGDAYTKKEHAAHTASKTAMSAHNHKEANHQNNVAKYYENKATHSYNVAKIIGRQADKHMSHAKHK